MKHLIWICSYPKSGNTWLRILLDSILLHDGNSVDINRIEIASRRIIKRNSFDEFLEFESDGLTPTEIIYYKQKYYLDYGLKATEDIFIKTHEANWKINEKLCLIPEEVTKLCVYIVRNPLDVVCSLANYHAIAIDKAIQLLGDRNYTLFGPEDGISYNVPVQVGDWSLNVSSWLNSKELPLIFIKYEDLLNKPVEILSGIMKGLNQPVDQSLIESAVDNHKFSRLANQETTHGFFERPRKTDVFFRKGQSGSWQEELSTRQVDKVINAHHKVIAQLGY
ncbi:sulfotransferase domain-containing protein [Roseivirga sp. E12]|uniref:sulfotransferase domain-containing protein n=1 Tax=Roseivirga sp. E12 TaxID=2819237 RepID=UPI001ABC20E0|nr:sulfotransferase domain-containing protein [Roseivirga sp. E12]MBO3699055.1 sulfotransferase domain-containing protein [Roseivirga sp. E12]